MPQGHLPRDQELHVAVGPVGVPGGREAGKVVLGELVQDAVVEEDVPAVQAGDDHVLVVARIAQQRRVAAVRVGHARDILVNAAGAELELRPDRSVRILHVQVRSQARAAAEHRVQIERRRTRIGREQRVLGDAQRRGLIERDVVVGELPHERRAGRHRRVIRVGPVGIRGRGVSVDGRIHDQRLRPGAQLIARIEDPTRPADVHQRRANCVRGIRKRRQIGEDPPEVDPARRRAVDPQVPAWRYCRHITGHDTCMGSRRGGHGPGDQTRARGARPFQELPPRRAV